MQEKLRGGLFRLVWNSILLCYANKGTMDLLKAELERKRRTLVASSSGSGRDHQKKRYLTAAERRQFEEDEEDKEEELRRERRRRRKRRKKQDDDEGKEEEDLTTLLTRKHVPASGRGEGAARVAQQEEQRTTGEEEKAGADVEGAGDEAGADNNATATSSGSHEAVPASLQKMSSEEVTIRLRGYGLPVRLFGEFTTTIQRSQGGSNDGDARECDDTPRLRRLAAAMKGREAALLGESEKDEYLLEGANRTRNVFLEKDAHHDSFGAEAGAGGHRPAETKHTEGGGGRPDGVPAAVALTEEERNDKPKRIYRYFKSLLRQWEGDLAGRTDAVRRTAAGKNETKTLKQCRDYIRPLFRECKHRVLQEDLQKHLFDIVVHCEAGEFVRAHDAYMDVAIGRAAWPIGVTMVGIHARSGRAKIESANVAHVMNSEQQRKYLTSVKRLMSYAQRQRPDVHPSKKVMNL